MGQKNFDLCALFNGNRHADAVDARLNQTVFCFTLGQNNGLEEKFGVILELNFRMDLSLDELRWEVAQVEHCVKIVANSFKIVLGGKCH